MLKWFKQTRICKWLYAPKKYTRVDEINLYLYMVVTIFHFFVLLGIVEVLKTL